MEETTQNDLREYLLGSTSDEARERLEEKLMTDDEAYENLEAAETDLIDEYVRNDLSVADRARFDEYFLAAPERQDSVKFARALDRYIKTVPEPVPEPVQKKTSFLTFWRSRSFAFQFASALTVLLVAVGAVWLYSSRSRGPQSLASLTLTMSAATRDSGVPVARLKLAPEVGGARISLKLPEGVNETAINYVALLSDAGITKRLAVAERRPGLITVFVPGEFLTSGPYALKLFRRSAAGNDEPVTGNYLFMVE